MVRYLPGVTYQIPAWVTISHINPLTLLDNLLNFAPALFSRALISFGEQLIRSVQSRSRSDRIEWKD